MIEQIAQIIYLYAGGMYPCDHIHVYGKEQEKWENIPEWMRDDYRLQAEKVLEFINDINKVNEMEASMGDPEKEFEFRRNKKRKRSAR